MFHSSIFSPVPFTSCCLLMHLCNPQYCKHFPSIYTVLNRVFSYVINPEVSCKIRFIAIGILTANPALSITDTARLILNVQRFEIELSYMCPQDKLKILLFMAIKLDTWLAVCEM